MENGMGEVVGGRRRGRGHWGWYIKMRKKYRKNSSDRKGRHAVSCPFQVFPDVPRQATQLLNEKEKGHVVTAHWLILCGVVGVTYRLMWYPALRMGQDGQ